MKHHGGHQNVRRHHHKTHGGKDKLAHSSATHHANPHGKMPSIAHGYNATDQHYGGDGEGAGGHKSNEKHC